MKWFFLDAETDGLYGPFLSAAALVTDDTGREIEHLYASRPVREEDIASEWVRKNVLPHLRNAEAVSVSENELLETVWSFWMKHRDGAYCVADVGFPVEARLFSECVRHDPAGREFLAPFPLLDLGTLLVSSGIFWDAPRQELSGLALAPHDPLNDVRLAAACWFRYRGNARRNE